MIFDVMSERDAVAFSQDPYILPCVIISIRNPEDEDVIFHDNSEIKAVLNMKFYDTEEEERRAFQNSDAERIFAFVEEFRDKVEQIVVHCREGVSRSAGVCAALMKYLNGDDSEIFEDDRFRPNKRCYNYMLACISSHCKK